MFRWMRPKQSDLEREVERLTSELNASKEHHESFKRSTHLSERKAAHDSILLDEERVDRIGRLTKECDRLSEIILSRDATIQELSQELRDVKQLYEFSLQKTEKAESERISSLCKVSEFLQPHIEMKKAILAIQEIVNKFDIQHEGP